MKYININKDDGIMWKESLENYRSYLESIKLRFPKFFYTFYTKVGMHDCILVKFELDKRHLANRTCVDVHTLWKKNGKQFSLIFKDVKNINTNIDLCNGYCEFGDYIIGEFLAVDEKFLSFEFLFYDSRNTIKLVFKKLYYQSKPKQKGVYV